ncbi:MAG: glycosyltransferase family 4 protein [Alphaproteobacteria bacterium]|jgi:glycosyltransferase involved in cell wall biosynthesis|nr:glycosyltransferase family 4 protein [Alphaproteobacteria bacterium]MBT4711894.1 glycosyltransferase family 4 protein [Alphaproteobacteria bacterium]MBT5859678.1 glycosyltransferase family 4 protein [Alphaproteobacteria bacterium]
MTKLLFLLNDAPFFVSHRLVLAKAAVDAGWDVHVAVPFEADAVKTIKDAGVTHHHIPLRRGARGLVGELQLFGAMWNIVGKLRPDILHAVTMKPVLYGGIIARMRRVPAVVHAITGLGYLFLIDGFAARIQRALVKVLYTAALSHPNARVIFQNPDDLELFLSEHLVHPHSHRMIKGCGVSMDDFLPSPEPGGDPVVLFPARIIGDKGVREFVEAARILKAQGVNARFRLVGRTDPDNPTDIGEATIRKWQADGMVEWRGFSTEMAAEFAQCHIVCMPSYREGLPRVLIEAAASGRVIVTSDVPGCREIVRNGETGILVPVRDGPATADALRTLIEDPDLRRTMGAAGRTFAVDKFSVTDFVAKSIDVYDQVLKPAEIPGPK